MSELSKKVYAQVACVEIDEMGLFDEVRSEPAEGKDPAVYFHVNKGDYYAFVRQAKDPVQAGYTACKGGPSKIEHLSLLEGKRTVMLYSADGTFEEKKLSQADAANPKVTGFIDDLVRTFR